MTMAIGRLHLTVHYILFFSVSNSYRQCHDGVIGMIHFSGHAIHARWIHQDICHKNFVFGIEELVLLSRWSTTPVRVVLLVVVYPVDTASNDGEVLNQVLQRQKICPPKLPHFQQHLKTESSLFAQWCICSKYKIQKCACPVSLYMIFSAIYLITWCTSLQEKL